ncbi:hypothetical protein ACQPTN_39695 [Bradyrhizobium sp. 13971]
MVLARRLRALGDMDLSMTGLSQDADLACRIAMLEQKLQSSAIETERLQRELVQSRDCQTASADILATIAGASGDADRALEQIAETTARLIGASSVSIQLTENGEWARPTGTERAPSLSVRRCR